MIKEISKIKPKSSRFINKLGIYFLRLTSIIIYLSGLIDTSYNTMLIGILVFWVCNILYCLENLKSRILFLIFNLVIFVFLISRPTIDLFRKSMWFQFEVNENLFSLNSLFISLICLWIGNRISEKISKTKEINLTSVQKDYIYKDNYRNKLEIVSLILFYLSIGFLFCIEFEKLIFMSKRSYEEIYVSFNSKLPFFINIIGSMCKYFLCIFLASLPSKKKAFLPLLLYILSALPYFLIGGRYKLVINLIFVMVYYIIRDMMDSKEKWLGLKEKLILILASPVGIAFLGAYNYIREGKKIEPGGVIGLIVDFFYKQGVSFDVLRIGYKTIPKIKYTGFVNYTFGEILDYVLHGNIAQILWSAKPLGVGQNEILGLYSNLLANRIAYTAAKDYFLSGHGWGSSYLLDTYADWGYLGIIIFSLILGSTFMFINFFLKKGYIYRTLALLILTGIYYCPRSSALMWISFCVYAQFYIPMILCFVGAKLFLKNYSLKNHLSLVTEV